MSGVLEILQLDDDELTYCCPRIFATAGGCGKHMMESKIERKHSQDRRWEE